MKVMGYNFFNLWINFIYILLVIGILFCGYLRFGYFYMLNIVLICVK